MRFRPRHPPVRCLLAESSDSWVRPPDTEFHSYPYIWALYITIVPTITRDRQTAVLS